MGDLGDDAQIVGDKQDRHAELLLQSPQQVEDLCLDGDVEGGRRFVGDQQRRGAGKRHRHHDPLAHAARHLVRIVVESVGGVRNLRVPEHVERPVARFGPADRLM